MLNNYHTKDLSKYHFLITGGAGFIGSNIVNYLVKHNAGKIRIADNLSNGYKYNIEEFLHLPNVEFHQVDLTDFEVCKKMVEGIDFVSHQAALGSVPRSIENPIATHNANVNAFMNLLVASKEAGVKRLVYASSSSVYGDNKTLPKVEDKIGNALSPYAVSKRVDELYAEVFYKIYNLPNIGLRYFNIYGPNQSPDGAYAAAIPLFMKALLRNQSPTIFGDGLQTRDFTFVENAVQANIKAMLCEDTNAYGQIFNIACGERTSILDMFNILKKYAGASVEPTFKQERKGDVRDSLADITKAKNILGYEPKVFFDEGLRITLEWFKNSCYNID
ncbi:MAG: epimerase [Bacteroidia bacterium]|nr:MAG: epimerase [Bacteroidia bacterium]